MFEKMDGRSAANMFDNLDIKSIVPRIKSTNYLNLINQANIGNVNRASLPIIEPLVGSLIVTYAFDIPGIFIGFMEIHLEMLKIKREDLRSIALQNLKRKSPEIICEKVLDMPTRCVRTDGRNLNACTLLAPGFWNSLEREMGGEIVLAVPERDTVIFTSTATIQGIQMLNELAFITAFDEPEQFLTLDLLVWRNQKWNLFEYDNMGNYEYTKYFINVEQMSRT